MEALTSHHALRWSQWVISGDAGVKVVVVVVQTENEVIASDGRITEPSSPVRPAVVEGVGCDHLSAMPGRCLVGQRDSYRTIARQHALASPSPTEPLFSLSAPKSRPSSPTMAEGGRRLPIHRRVRAPITPSNMPIGGCVAFRSLPSPRWSLSSACAPKRWLASQLSRVGCLAQAIFADSKMS